MGVDHGGFYVFVPEKFLHCANIIAGFEQVGGEGVAKGVGRDGLIYFCETGSAFDGFLQAGLVDMVAAFGMGHRVNREFVGREDVLPDPFAAGVGVFQREGVGQVDCTSAFEEVFFVQGFDAFEVQAQGFEQGIGKLINLFML